MHRPRFRFSELSLFLLPFLFTLQARAEPVTTPTVAALPAAGAITIDGKLDEPAWRHAGMIELTQQSPHPGQPTPFHTQILLLHDGHMLYIGVICDDPNPVKIATHTLVRDGDQSNDDSVTMMLDTFGTKRVAYVFQVNAAGAMADGLIAPTPSINSNNGVDYNWDGIWQAAVSRNDHGWTAEIAIDTRSLQFGHGVTAWGFNVSRYVPRAQLTLVWSGINLNASVMGLQWEGTLTGVQGVQQGNGWDFQPYGLVKSQTGASSTSNAGFDLKYNFTPSLAGLFTYHTDFAEAEADQQQINTTRFPLSFPEKRQFFLQGSNLFSFGYKLANAGFIPYYSRSIGLVSGEQVPLNEGVKLLGQSDNGSLALLDTQMAGSNVSDSTNLFAARGAYNVDQNLQVGTLITHGDPLGISDNTFVGTDALWQTASFTGDKNLNLAAWAGRSSGNLPSGNPDGYGFDIEYPNDLWYATTQVNVFGDALDPGIGFLQRPGTRQYYTELDYKPRPPADSLFDWVRQFFFDSYYSEVDGLSVQDGGKQGSEWWFSPAFISNNGYYLEFDAYQTYDAPNQAFQPAPTVTIPAGQYTWNRARIAFNTPESEPLVFDLIASAGGYYNGREIHPYIGVNWNTPSGRLQFNASQEDLFGYLPEGDFIIRLSTLGATYSFTPNLYISEFAQYTNGIPGVSMNTRLRWIIGGASNIYVVWNHGQVNETNGIGQPIITQGNEFIFKVQWDYRD
ncbi:MAG: DUF5916 domain-containing protein [Gammaproteobacteria bacterium]